MCSCSTSVMPIPIQCIVVMVNDVAQARTYSRVVPICTQNLILVTIVRIIM